MARAALAALAVTGAAAACGSNTDAPPPATAPVEDPKRPITGPIALDLGRTFDGYMLTATAIADAVGWSSGELRARGVAADGFLDIDFVALPPSAEALIAEAATPRSEAARRVIAFRPLSLADLRPLAGIRVNGRDGPTTITFTR
jgi:hypothetical protein